MKAFTFLGILVLASIGTASDSLRAGVHAPPFSASSASGKTETLASLTATRPVLLYFIDDLCPINAKAAPFFGILAKAYSSKVAFTGIINTDSKGYAEWQAKFKAPYQVLLDPSERIIKSYSAPSSPTIVLIGKNHRVLHSWVGYSTRQLTEISKALALAAHVPPKKLDFSHAPKAITVGCRF